MKCQPVKYSKHSQPNQISAVHPKVKHRPAQSHQEIGNANQNKDQVLNGRQGIQNVRYGKMTPGDVSRNSSPIFSSLYAGPKFSGAPSPTDLPKPPPHWTSTPFITPSGSMFPIHGRPDKHHEFISQFKILVNTPA